MRALWRQGKAGPVLLSAPDVPRQFFGFPPRRLWGEPAGAGDFQKKEGENAESRLQSVRLKAILCLAYIR